MPAKYTKIYPAKKIDFNGKLSKLNLPLACESTLELYLNGKRFTTLFASPTEFQALAIGHLLTEGILTPEAISEIKLTEKKGEKGKIIEIELKAEQKLESLSETEKLEKEIYVESDTIFEAKSLFAGINYLESGPYRRSRGTHLAALVDRKGKMLARAIDVGRHNAVDKVIGKALFEGLSLSELYLLSTGRQPGYMVLKAAKAGIPLIVTKAMPLDSGVEIAKKTNVGLVGKLSKDSLLGFANLWRVKV